MIEAVTVNHNSSVFAELMIRSLLHRNPGVSLKLTVMDNNSTDGDDLAALKRYASEAGVDFTSSGFHVAPSTPNSHGIVLRSFVMDHPECTHYLFIDPDVCFLESGVIEGMLDELSADDHAFGIMPRSTLPAGVAWLNQESVIRYTIQWPGCDESTLREARALVRPRLHPFCALIENTPLFRSVVEEVGLALTCTLAPKGGFNWDTLGLATSVMKTHGFHYLVSLSGVHHFFGVSYDPAGIDSKRARCQEWLAELRAGVQ